MLLRQGHPAWTLTPPCCPWARASRPLSSGPPSCFHLLQGWRPVNALEKDPHRGPLPWGRDEGLRTSLPGPPVLSQLRRASAPVLEARRGRRAGARARSQGPGAGGLGGWELLSARHPDTAGQGGAGPAGAAHSVYVELFNLLRFIPLFINGGLPAPSPTPAGLILQIRTFLAFSGERRRLWGEAGRRGGTQRMGATVCPPPPSGRGREDPPSPADRGKGASAVNGPDATHSPAARGLWHGLPRQLPPCGAGPRGPAWRRASIRCGSGPHLAWREAWAGQAAKASILDLPKVVHLSLGLCTPKAARRGLVPPRSVPGPRRHPQHTQAQASAHRVLGRAARCWAPQPLTHRVDGCRSGRQGALGTPGAGETSCGREGLARGGREAGSLAPRGCRPRPLMGQWGQKVPGKEKNASQHVPSL